MIEYLGRNKAKFIVNIGSGKNRKRKSKTVTYNGKKELQKMYERFEAEAKQDALSDLTVDELVAGYIRYKKTLGSVATTIRGYNVCLSRFEDALRYEKARKVTPYQLEDFVAVSSDKWSPKTIRNTIGLLSASYNRAIRLGLLEDNPCDRITLPKNKNPEIITMDEGDVLKFMEVLQNERIDYKVAYELCLLCGLRRSEVLGLRECDFDAENGTIAIRQTRHIVNGERVIQPTKTVKSERVIALPQVLIEDIKKCIEKHNKMKWKRSDYLVLTSFGEELSPSTMSNHLRNMEKEKGLPLVSVHGLRHTFATMLNADGIDIARISAELGHSNITTTLNRYTHVFGNATASSRGIAEGMDKKFSKTATFVPLSKNEKTAEA